ncbi:Glucose-6-phosphate 1-dehydrogenase [Lecanora helva]
MWSKIEKPFGHDLESSRELQSALDPNWREDEIFRVDHYLGKEVVNNLLVLRFGNEIFNAVWNHDHIDSVEVRVLETIPAINNEETLIGQYGKSRDGSKPAFKDEDDVPDNSHCATFCAAIVHVENERWTGVPFMLKAGKGDLLPHLIHPPTNKHPLIAPLLIYKALNESKTEILIHFKPSPNATIFDSTVPNKMTIRIQPDEGVFLTINSFVPNLETKVDAIDLDLTYRGREIPEAYEALLADALAGDFSRSVRGDEVDAGWRIWTPLLRFLDGEEGGRPRGYAYGECMIFVYLL